MASFNVDPSNVGSTQNPYDFGGVSVSMILIYNFYSLSPHHLATSAVQSVPVPKLELPSNASEPL
jgi:hypothetical protein